MSSHPINSENFDVALVFQSLKNFFYLAISKKQCVRLCVLLDKRIK